MSKITNSAKGGIKDRGNGDYKMNKIPSFSYIKVIESVKQFAVGGRRFAESGVDFLSFIV